MTSAIARSWSSVSSIATPESFASPGQAGGSSEPVKLSGGKVPEAQWLKGDGLGWRGPWGTTYPGNLRLFMQKVSEEQWLKIAKTVEYRPPMPWFNLHHMSSSDLRAVYRYVRHLGPAGQPAPDYVPPERTPAQPYVQFP